MLYYIKFEFKHQIRVHFQRNVCHIMHLMHSSTIIVYL